MSDKACYLTTYDLDVLDHACEPLVVSGQIENLLVRDRLQAQDLAKRMHRSKSWVSKLLSGRQNTTLDTLAEVAIALGVRWQPVIVEADSSEWLEGLRGKNPTSDKEKP